MGYNKREGKFLSVQERNRRLANCSIPIVPFIAQRAFSSKEELKDLMKQKSSYYNGDMEGIYLRIDETAAQGARYLQKRGKIVRPHFLQQIEQNGHFSKMAFVK